MTVILMSSYELLPVAHLAACSEKLSMLNSALLKKTPVMYVETRGDCFSWPLK